MSHVAFLVPELEAGGAQRVMLLLAREFARRGHKVDLVMLQASGPLLHSVPQEVRLVDLGTSSNTRNTLMLGIAGTWRLKNWLEKEQPEAMLSTITGTNIVALLARALGRIRTRIVVREAVTLENVTSRARLLAMRLLYPRADGVVALSAAMADQLARKIGILRSRLHCIPNPVDVSEILRQASAPLDHPWFDADAPAAIVTAGRLIPQKDHATLIRAFALLPSNRCTRLVILGDGPERSALESLATTLGIAKQIHFAGFDPNPWRWMARARLFVLSSRWEGHPNALLEADVLGLPIITTAYEGSAHLASELEEGVRLRTVPVGNPAMLASSIAEELSVAVSTRTTSGERACNLDAVSMYEEVLLPPELAC